MRLRIVHELRTSVGDTLEDSRCRRVCQAIASAFFDLVVMVAGWRRAKWRGDASAFRMAQGQAIRLLQLFLAQSAAEAPLLRGSWKPRL